MRYAGDPYWATARFESRCKQSADAELKRGCRSLIRKGDRIFYYPASRSVLCDSCGERAAADFAAHAFDEDVYAAQR